MFALAVVNALAAYYYFKDDSPTLGWFCIAISAYGAAIVAHKYIVIPL